MDASFPYNPANWHWSVASEGRIWSSAAGSFVATADTPITEIGTIEELDWVLRHASLKSPLITGADINAERDKRVAAGTVFAVTGYGEVHLTGRLQDQTVLAMQLIKAQAAKVAGVTAPIILLRDADNVNHVLTPDQAIELIDAGTAWVEAVMKVSWDMKDGIAPFEAGPPEGFTDDIWWPAGDGA